MAELAIKHLPVANVEFNPWNPNKQSERQFQAEIESILSNGFIMPILVREVAKNKWQIVDGEHRKRALDIIINDKLEGQGNVPDLVKNQEIPAVIIDLDDAKAKRLTVIMNETRGRADMGSLAELLSSIQEDLGEDLLIGLPYTPNQLNDLLKLSEFDWDSLTAPEIDEVPSGDGEHSAQVQALLTPEIEALWNAFKAIQSNLPKNPKEAAGKLIGILLENYNN